jgi:iron-sulfur cluster assembly protein
VISGLGFIGRRFGARFAGEQDGMTITLTPDAISKVQQFIEDQSAVDGAGLRVAVLPGGCSGFQYGLNIEDAPEADDEIFDLDGFRLFVDPFSAQYLEGVEIDYVTSMMGSGFAFRNPNAAGGCGCGSSFTV